MVITINIEKHIEAIVLGIGYDLENSSLGIIVLYWTLKINFKKQ